MRLTLDKKTVCLNFGQNTALQSLHKRIGCDYQKLPTQNMAVQFDDHEHCNGKCARLLATLSHQLISNDCTALILFQEEFLDKVLR